MSPGHLFFLLHVSIKQRSLRPLRQSVAFNQSVQAGDERHVGISLSGIALWRRASTPWIWGG